MNSPCPLAEEQDWYRLGFSVGFLRRKTHCTGRTTPTPSILRQLQKEGIVKTLHEPHGIWAVCLLGCTEGTPIDPIFCKREIHPGPAGRYLAAIPVRVIVNLAKEAVSTTPFTSGNAIN